MIISNGGKETSKILSVEEALESSRKDVIERYKRHMNPELASLLAMVGYDRKFCKASGMKIYDETGREYLDFLGGYGALNLGHNQPEVIEALKSVFDLPNIFQASIGIMSGALAEALSEITPGNLTRSFFGNSGAEAVEGALKLARISTGRKKLLYTHNSFHGKTFGALSVTGRKYQEPFQPLLPECHSVPYGDSEALADELRKKEYAGFIVEPIQGEGGIIVPPEGYLKEVESLCEKYGTLLIADEIQTGFGRTGKMFGVQHENVEPDIMTLAKSLGGGVMPLGAYITSDEVWKKGYGSRDKCLLHTSTFGGNNFACAVGLKTIEILIRDKLDENARTMGERLKKRLEKVVDENKLIKEVRGRGLMIGAEFYEPQIARNISSEYLASMVCAILFQDYGVITAYTLSNPNVIRFEPPLIVNEREIDYVAESVEAICREQKNLLGVTFDLGKRLVKQRLGLGG